jgi:hypothetical protein
MFTWAGQRQLMYGTGVFLFLLVFIGLPIYFTFFNNPPTCFDAKQNGDEAGVDCGGSCQRACTGQVLPEPIVLWSRSFTIARGLNNLVAYIQNPNVNYTAEPLQYIFSVYDSDNVLLGIREGYAYIPATKTFPIFEAAFNAGEKIPTKVVFAFTAPAKWNKSAVSDAPVLTVVDQRILDANTSPRIYATLENSTVYKYKNIEVVAIVYDADGNAFAASKTVVDNLPGSGSAPLVFTWPSPFATAVSKVEIIPKLPI